MPAAHWDYVTNPLGAVALMLLRLESATNSLKDYQHVPEMSRDDSDVLSHLWR